MEKQCDDMAGEKTKNNKNPNRFDGKGYLAEKHTFDKIA